MMKDPALEPSCILINEMMSSNEPREEVLNAEVLIQLDVDELPEPKRTGKQRERSLKTKRELKKRDKEEQTKEEVDRLRHAGCLCEGYRVSGGSYGWTNCDQCRAKVANLALGNTGI